MIDHIWSVLCLRASVDSRTNNVSLLEVLEEIGTNAPQSPSGVGVAVQASLVSLWARTPAQTPARGTSRVFWERPGGGVDQIVPNVDLDLSTYERLRNIAEIYAVPYYGPGIYYLRVEFRESTAQPWKVTARVPVKFNFVGPVVPALAPLPKKKSPTKKAAPKKQSVKAKKRPAQTKKNQR